MATVTLTTRCSVGLRPSRFSAATPSTAFPAPGSARLRQVKSSSPATLQRRTAQVVSAGPIADVSLVPSLVPILLRATTAGVLFYASMNWVFYRRERKEGEKRLEGWKKREEERKEKINKLGPSDRED